MTEFSTEAELSFSDRSLSRASRQLERELSGITISHETDTTAGRIGNQQDGVSSTIASTAVGTKLSGVSGSLEETLELDQERNVLLSEVLEATERSAGGGGGVSGLIGLGSMAGLLSGGVSLSSLITPVSLSALVSSVSLSALVTGGLAISTLITGGVMARNLIQGDVSPSDIITPLNTLGDLITGPLPLTDVIETGVGLGTFIAGGVSIASFVTGTSITSLLTGTSITSLVSGTGIVSLVSGVGLGSLVSGVSLASLVNPVTLTAIVGGVAITALVTGKIDIADYVGSDGAGSGSYGPDEMRTSASTPAAQQPYIDYDALEGFDEPTEEEVENFDPSTFSLGDIPGGEPIGEFGESGSESTDSETTEGESGDERGGEDKSRTRGGGTPTPGTQSGTNRAREQSSRPAQITYSPTYNLEARDLERKMDQDLREIERRLDDLERAFDQ